jgi:hypothetical protein
MAAPKAAVQPLAWKERPPRKPKPPPGLSNQAQGRPRRAASPLDCHAVALLAMTTPRTPRQLPCKAHSPARIAPPPPKKNRHHSSLAGLPRRCIATPLARLALTGASAMTEVVSFCTVSRLCGRALLQFCYYIVRKAGSAGYLVCGTTKGL